MPLYLWTLSALSWEALSVPGTRVGACCMSWRVGWRSPTLEPGPLFATPDHRRIVSLPPAPTSPPVPSFTHPRYHSSSTKIPYSPSSSGAPIQVTGFCWPACANLRRATRNRSSHSLLRFDFRASLRPSRGQRSSNIQALKPCRHEFRCASSHASHVQPTAGLEPACISVACLMPRCVRLLVIAQL